MRTTSDDGDEVNAIGCESDGDEVSGFEIGGGEVNEIGCDVMSDDGDGGHRHEVSET